MQCVADLPIPSAGQDGAKGSLHGIGRLARAALRAFRYLSRCSYPAPYLIPRIHHSMNTLHNHLTSRDDGRRDHRRWPRQRLASFKAKHIHCQCLRAMQDTKTGKSHPIFAGAQIDCTQRCSMNSEDQDVSSIDLVVLIDFLLRSLSHVYATRGADVSMSLTG